MRIQTSLLLVAGSIIVGGALVGTLIWKATPTTNRIDLSRDAVILRMQDLGRLETSSFSIEKIIEAGNGSEGGIKEFLFGDKLLLVAHGEVLAGVDLSLLGKDDIKVSGTSVTLKLPGAMLFSARLDSSKTRVYDRTRGIIAATDKDLESDARAAAEASIRQAACDAGILIKATTSAENEVRALLSALGFVDIHIELGPPSGC